MTTSTPAYDALATTYTRLHRMSHLGAIAGWDQAANMPSKGVQARADAMAELAALLHRMRTDPQLATHIERAEQDEFALRSHQLAVRAQSEGRFDDELCPIAVPPSEKGQPPVQFARDEGPRGDSSLAKLAKLAPAFRSGGSVTAGNSSTLNDGAAALLIGTADKARELGLRPLVRIAGGAAAGVDPRYMGIGPVPAVRKLLGRLGVALGDVERVELNEAFAAQALAVLRELNELPLARVNSLGGAIALGHPLGCSGARIATTLSHELRRSGCRYGLAAMCIGVGQGVAALFEQPEA